MKQYPNFSLMLLTSIIVLLNLRCTKVNNNNFVVGTVFDTKTSRTPVEGVKVTLSDCDGTYEAAGLICHGTFKKIGEINTDAQGHFRILDKYGISSSIRYIVVEGSLLNSIEGQHEQDLPTEFFLHN